MQAKSPQTRPFLLFWLGVLTGAIVVGLLFLYRLYSPELGGANLFRSYTYPSFSSSYQTGTRSISDPTPWNPKSGVSISDPTPW